MDRQIERNRTSAHPSRRYRSSLQLGVLTAAIAASSCASFTPAPATPDDPMDSATEGAGAERVALPALDDLVPYRELSRADFRAEAPPRGRGDTSAHVAAATCAYLIYDPALKFRATKRANEPDFSAEVTNLRFEARMDPSCSWWDRANRFRPDDYVLEHEQIHFALVEIEARRLNRDLDGMAERLRSRGATGAEALQEIQRKFREEFDRAVARTAARTRQFDEETSLGFRPEAQSEWAQRVQRELEEVEVRSSD